MSTNLTTNTLFGNGVKKKFDELLGEKAPGFISSVLQVVNSSTLLKSASPSTILNAAATAAALDLPINQNLGFAWIVPYKGQAQFQIGWKGFVQLALRTGQYKAINVIEVYENQFHKFNRLTEELDADFTIEGENEVVGFASYFRLNNGMEKTIYWTKEEVVKHAEKYSQSYKYKTSAWQTDFKAMAKKTVLKNMISKWGIMSIEMQKAQLADQSIQEEENNFNYADNTIDVDPVQENEEDKRVSSFIEKCKTEEDLDALFDSLDSGLQVKFVNQIETKKEFLIKNK